MVSQGKVWVAREAQWVTATKGLAGAGGWRQRPRTWAREGPSPRAGSLQVTWRPGAPRRPLPPLITSGPLTWLPGDRVAVLPCRVCVHCASHAASADSPGRLRPQRPASPALPAPAVCSGTSPSTPVTWVFLVSMACFQGEFFPRDLR